ncbi:hypothetical protein Lal_00022005 [Lupinus albus]|nr:hypothetical protein Lal_00022005 [Lupinus albus]
MMMESLDSKADCNNTNVVFIDTTLHTHFALFVNHSDTVSHLKKRILVEHPLCFPKIGHIEIHAVKVKRKGCFYHLSDSVLVKSAFNGVSKDWFLSVDASALVDVSPERVSGFNYSPLPQLENKQDEKEVPFVSTLVSEHTRKEIVEYLGEGVKSSINNDSRIPLPLSIPETEDHRHENNELSSLQIERELDRTSKSTPKDDYRVNEEVPSISVASVKKQRKSKRKKDGIDQDDISKEDIASVDNVLSVASKSVSRSINFKVPQVENKLDEKEKNQFASPRVSENTGKVDKKSGKGVKSSSNNDTGIPLLGSIPETENHDNIKKELRSKVDRSSKGTTKDDYNVHEEDPLTPMPSVKEKRSKRKKGGVVQDDTSKENIGSVDNPLSVPSRNVSSLNNFQTPQLESKHDEKEGVGIGDESMKEASTEGPAANKKHKKRKRSSTHDSKETLEVEVATQKDAAQKPDEAHKQSKGTKDQLEYNNDKSRDYAQSKKNEVTEDFSDARPPAKKKHKGKHKSEDKSLSKEKSSMVSDFNVENAPDHLLEDQQKIKNSSNEQSAEHFKDAEPPKTSVPGRRKKGKKNKSNPLQTPVVTSSRKGYEADPTSIGGGIEEEISEVGILSKGDTT